MIFVNYRYQSDTVTVAELPTKGEAHAWIQRYYRHCGPPGAFYQSERSTKEWRDRIKAWDGGHDPI